MQQEEFKDIKCNFNLYRSFYAVAITGSFSEAARLLYVSQPSLSYNVKQLEERLNTNLFYRKINGVSLTIEGEKLLTHVKNAFNSIIKAEEMLSDSNLKSKRTFSIGAATHILNFRIMPKIIEFMNDNPDIHLKIIEKSSASLKEMLQNEEIDIIIDDSFNIPDNQNFEIKEFYKEKCCFAGTKELMDKCTSIENLCNSSLVLPSIGANLRRLADAYFIAHNLKCFPSIEAYTTETIVSLVEANKGIGFFYEGSIKDQIDTGKLIKYDDNDEMPEVSLCYMHLKGNQSDILNAFVMLLNR